MDGWAGFTEEDVKKLNTSTNKPQRRAPQSKPRPQRAVQPMKKQSRDAPTGSSAVSTDIPAAARLSQPAPAVRTQTTDNNSKKSANPAEQPMVSVKSNSEQPEEPAPAEHVAQQDIQEKPVTEPQVSAAVLTEDDGRSRDLSNLQQYQQQQKMMEELNKKKKKMLADVLAQRQKQATTEAKKLNAIKKELSVLDHMLTADVNVIRDRIEEATRVYTDASKRYELAEKEYIEAKINLHKRSEMKEQLTEHLYTIIHQNEVRKANKLAELMDQLNLATEEGVDTDSSTLPDLPSYSLLGNMQTVGSGNLAKPSPVTTPLTTPVMSPQTDAPQATEVITETSTQNSDNPTQPLLTDTTEGQSEASKPQTETVKGSEAENTQVEDKTNVETPQVEENSNPLADIIKSSDAEDLK